MPIWVYDCERCGAEVENICSFEKRDDPLTHEDCGGKLVRRGVQPFTTGKESFQGGAILSNGQKIPGHWGKSARKKKSGWHRP